METIEEIKEKKSVLVIEPNPEKRVLLSTIVESLGFEITPQENGTAALGMFDLSRFNFVFMNLSNLSILETASVLCIYRCARGFLIGICDNAEAESQRMSRLGITILCMERPICQQSVHDALKLAALMSENR